jgi:hypothetical protein
MWDLTVPGDNDHDFYIDTGSGTVLVHNEDGPCPTSPNQMQRQIEKRQAPQGVDRICTRCSYSADNPQPHVHFTNKRPTLNMDGTWGHGGSIGLSNEIIQWLLDNGWGTPDE